MTTKELREKLGMTVAQFAEAVGAAPRTVAYWEAGGFVTNESRILRPFRSSMMRLEKKVEKK